jgi:tetratricopeptide (TPR) repeat protein
MDQAEANRETLEGIARMEMGEWPAALACFERAIVLREALPWREHSLVAWGLAAGLINRGDVLRRLDDPQTEMAMASYERAIEVLDVLPMNENAAFPERLMLAWINRGTTAGEMQRKDLAEECFEEAERLFSIWKTGFRPERILLESMLRVNRARVFVEAGRIEAACAESDRGVKVLSPLEPGEGLIAEAGVRARAMRCRALAEWLDHPGLGEPEVDWIAAATDAVEEALAIMKRSRMAVDQAADLVRYGARIYRSCQPQFLAGFIRDWLAQDGPLAGDEALREEMKNVILLARHEAEQRLLIAPHDDAVAAREMRIIRSLME